MGRTKTTHFLLIMNENDYKSLIVSYQQKSFDLFSQVVSLEAKLNVSNQLVEALTQKVNELKSEIESLKSKPTKTEKS